MKLVQLVDASILINIVGIPMESQNRSKVLSELESRAHQGVDLIIPIASIIETAQHIQRTPNGHERRRCAQFYGDIVRQTVEGVLPWRFIDLTWDGAFLLGFLDQQPPRIPDLVRSLAEQIHEAGDLLLLSELEMLRNNLSRTTHHVSVWTLDDVLDATANG